MKKFFYRLLKEYLFPLFFSKLIIVNDSINNKNYWLYILITKPHLYLYNLIKNTILTGIISGLIFFLFEKYGNHRQAVPTTFHNLISFVLAMVLVFRTNTAYDRWWKARELFSKLEYLHYYFISILKIKIHNKKINQKQLKEYKESLNNLLDLIYVFLVEKSELDIKRKFLDEIYKIQILNNSIESLELDMTIKDTIDVFTQLERILDTPIPTSYSLHIKLSIFTYLLTLPFGIFYDLGYWSIPLVMILYCIIAGVEIISNEIENPFKNDPNDLPVKKYLEKIKEEIESELNF